MKEFLRLTVWGILLFFLQSFVFSRMGIFEVGNIFVHLLFFLIMPLKVRSIPLMIIAFIYGLLLDMLTYTYGIHAFSCTLMVAVRSILLPLIFDKDDLENGNRMFIGFSFGYYRYVLLMLFIYCLSVFLLQDFSLKYILLQALKALVSTIASFIVMFFLNITILRGYNER